MQGMCLAIALEFILKLAGAGNGAIRTETGWWVDFLIFLEVV